MSPRMTDTFKRFALLAILVASFLLGNWAFRGAQQEPAAAYSSDSLASDLRLFSEIMLRLNRHYVEAIPSDAMLQDAIDSVMDDLDPHTHYFDAEDFARFQDDTSGHFGGIGVTIQSIDDTVTVMNTLPDTPAWRAGIVAGDRLIAVDGVSLVGHSADDAVELMRGEVGTSLLVTVARPGVPQPVEFPLQRAQVNIDSVPYAFVLDDGVGYIRLQQFNANASQELHSALQSMQQSDVRGLIMDLRGNPGGLLNEAIDTVSEFLGADRLVVSTRGRLPMYDQDFFTTRTATVGELPLVVLINEGSASASEIFAGALQDYDRALVMGETSFGKGSVQQLFPLSQGGLKLTTSYYYIPSGRCIHKAENDDLLLGREVGTAHSPCADSVFTTQAGRVVMGGGGITPDIAAVEVTLDRSARRLRARSAFFQFVTKQLQQAPASASDELPPAARQEFYDTYVREVYRDEDAIAHDREWIDAELRATWIELGYDVSEGQRVRVQADPLVKQAAALLAQAATQSELFAVAGVTTPVAGVQRPTP